MSGLHKQLNIPPMIVFISWLQQTFATFSPADPFYKVRLAAFKKLSCAAFIARQKESYCSIPLRETLHRFTCQGYQLKAKDVNQQIVNRVGYGAENDILTFIDGIWAKEQSTHIGPEVQLRRLTDLPFMEQQEVIKEYLADLESSDDLFDTFSMLLAQETYLLEVAAHLQLKKTITIQHIITDAFSHVVPQLLLKIGRESQVIVVENWYATTPSVQSFVNNLTHISLAEGATLAYHTLYTESPSFYHVNTLYCHQKAHSVFTHYSFSFSATMLRINLTVHIDGSHATAMLYGLYSLSAEEKVDHCIKVIHRYPNSLSKQHYKGILGGQSVAVFKGKVYLTPEAQKTNAYQTNNVIIVSQGAHHYVQPQLEIYADDVKCSHGATTGQLDEAQLFYLQARGIARPLAKRLLLEAFGSAIIDAVVVSPLQDYLWEKFLEKLVKL